LPEQHNPRPPEHTDLPSQSAKRPRQRPPRFKIRGNEHIAPLSDVSFQDLPDLLSSKILASILQLLYRGCSNGQNIEDRPLLVQGVIYRHKYGVSFERYAEYFLPSKNDTNRPDKMKPSRTSSLEAAQDQICDKEDEYGKEDEYYALLDLVPSHFVRVETFSEFGGFD